MSTPTITTKGCRRRPRAPRPTSAALGVRALFGLRPLAYSPYARTPRAATLHGLEGRGVRPGGASARMTISADDQYCARRLICKYIYSSRPPKAGRPTLGGAQLTIHYVHVEHTAARPTIRTDCTLSSAPPGRRGATAAPRRRPCPPDGLHRMSVWRTRRSPRAAPLRRRRP